MAKAKTKLLIESIRVVSQVLLRDHNDLERSRFCHASAVCASFCGFKVCGGQVDLVGAIVDSHGLGTHRGLNRLDDMVCPWR
jgi:hypothetical protein